MAKIHTLPNGIKVVTEERPGTKMVSMRIHFGVGGADEPIHENGLTYMTQEASWGGTTTRSRSEIAEEIESKGGSFSSTTGRTSTFFAANVLARETDNTFAVLADVVRNPAFDAAELKKTQAQVEQWLAQSTQHASQKTAFKFMEAAFDGQSVGLNPMGQPGVVSSFTPAQLKARHDKLMTYPDNMIISFAGDIDAATAEKLVTQYFGDLTPAAKPRPKTQIQFTGGDFREANNNEQLAIRFGFEAPSALDEDKYNYMIMNDILSGGMSSPLFREIRVKRGLVYSVNAAYLPFETAGTCLIAAETGEGKVGEFIQTSVALLGDMARHSFTDEELKTARARIMRSMKAHMESAGSVGVGNIAQLQLYGRLMSMEEIEQKLKQVTGADVQKAFYDMLANGKYVLAGVGPQDSMPSEQEIKDMMAAQVKDMKSPVPAVKPQKSLSVEFTKATQEGKIVANEAEPRITVLPNGMRVVSVDRPGTVSCGAWVGAGTDHETEKLNGATHMNEHMMFRGTPSYAGGTLDEVTEKELKGGSNAYTTYDRTCYYFYNMAPDGLEKVVDICGEMVFQANITEEDYAGVPVMNPDGSQKQDKNGNPAVANSEREVVLEEIRRANDNPGKRLFDNFFTTAYPNQAHGRTVLGTIDGLRQITSADLRAYRDQYYSSDNVVFALSGPVKHEDFVALIKKKFSHLQPTNVPPLYTPTYVGDTVHTEMDGMNGLCEVVLGVGGVSNIDSDHYVYGALAKVLGSGETSRLHKTLVNKKQLTAGVGAYPVGFRNSGLFCVSATIKPENMKAFVAATYEEVQQLVNDLSETELNKVKTSMEMSVLSQLETNQAICDAIGTGVLARGDKALSPAEISAEIQKITVADVKRVAKAVLASNPTMSTVVPTGVDRSLLPTHDEVVEMRDQKPKNGPNTEPKPEPGL